MPKYVVKVECEPLFLEGTHKFSDLVSTNRFEKALAVMLKTLGMNGKAVIESHPRGTYPKILREMEY